jgi:ligand-binding sensor domain-containing protein
MRICWTILFGFWLQALAAQSPAYLHYTVRDGLPGNLVYCGLQDQRGLLWFGTDKGLACFDGTHFRIYGVADGLPDPEVLNMQQDSEGRIWLFCFRKKPCYMLDGKIITEKQDSLLAQINFKTGTYLISEQTEKDWWLTELTKTTYHANENGIEKRVFPEEVVRFQKFGDTFLALGLNDFMRINDDGSVEVIYRIQGVRGFSSVQVSGNRILYSYGQVLLLFEWKNGKIIQLDKLPRPGGQLFADKLGRFWVCSPAFGAILFDNDRGDLSNPVTYLPDKKMIKMFEDAQGTLWFCTANEGIFALQKNAPVNFRTEAGIPSVNIRSLARNEVGQLFVGDDAGNINIFRGDKLERTIPTGTTDGYNHIRQIIPVGKGEFWVGSDETFQHYFNQFKESQTFISDVSIKALLLRNDRIWYAGATSLTNYPVDLAQPKLVIGNRFTAMDVDAGGNIWAGGVGGLYSEKDSFQTNWGDMFPELKNRIMTIRKAGPNQLWVATPADGLILLNVKDGAVTQLEVINKKLKNPIENIQSLFVEANGRVWLATNRGVYGIDRDWRVVHYDSHDGLVDDDVNDVLVYGDTLWAGTVSGLTRMVLRPEQEKGSFPTLVVRLRYQLGNQVLQMHLLDSLPMHRQVVLPSNITNVELDMAGLDYLLRGNLRFEIIKSNLLLPMQWWTFDNLSAWISRGFKGGLDTTTVEAGTFNLGAFLPAGRYRIQTTAVKASGVRSYFSDTWVIIKKPYWYESLWLYVILWLGLGYGVYRIYKARVAYREINAAASALQLQALQAQMNPHFIGNTVNAIQQFMHPPDPVKTSEYIALFMRLLRRTMDFSEQIFIPFEEELSYDQEYLKLVQLRFENKFQYQISGTEHVPPDTPIPSMLLQPVLENATIHGIAPEGISILKLDFSYDGKILRCTLTDNGIGLNESKIQKKHSGIERVSKGLSILYKKVNTLNILYDIDLNLNIEDMTGKGPDSRGTRVTMTYNPDKIWKAIKKRSVPPTVSER